MNPCKCRFYGDTTRECRCTPGQIQHYLGKIGGPLLDRIDIHVEIPSVPFKELRGNPTTESSAEIRARVEQARTVQHARGFYNSRMPVRDIREICALDDAGRVADYGFGAVVSNRIPLRATAAPGADSFSLKPEPAQ
jgi:magnesium chelatase family protein